MMLIECWLADSLQLVCYVIYVGPAAGDLSKADLALGWIEAAAATALFGFRSARPLFHTDFVANHPFLFLIYDNKADNILFFGVFQDPKL